MQSGNGTRARSLLPSFCPPSSFFLRPINPSRLALLRNPGVDCPLSLHQAHTHRHSSPHSSMSLLAGTLLPYSMRLFLFSCTLHSLPGALLTQFAAPSLPPCLISATGVVWLCACAPLLSPFLQILLPKRHQACKQRETDDKGHKKGRGRIRRDSDRERKDKSESPTEVRRSFCSLWPHSVTTRRKTNETRTLSETEAKRGNQRGSREESEQNERELKHITRKANDKGMG